MEPIRILITGDFCPINRIGEMAVSKKFEAIFNDFIKEFIDNDLNIVDLECPFTLSESARPKTGPHQKAPPDCVDILSFAGLNVVAMANNHIMDYDSEGALDVIDLCRKNGISTIGIGENPEDAAKPFTREIKGKTISVINCADNEFLTSTDGKVTCNPVDPLRLFYDITEAKKNSDYLIVIVHAGNEFYELPSPRTKELYRYIVDLGADVVISHHTHAYSGYEIYKSKPIFYGLGNFLYDWPGKRNTGWNQGYIVRLKLSECYEFEIVPLKQCNDVPGIFHLDEKERTLFFEKIDGYNRIISDEKKLESHFQEYCSSVYPMYDAFIEPGFGRYIAALRKRGLFPKLMSGKKRLLLLNLVRCESHRDVLLRMLKHQGKK
jgi:hypothetical protein